MTMQSSRLAAALQGGPVYLAPSAWVPVAPGLRSDVGNAFAALADANLRLAYADVMANIHMAYGSDGTSEKPFAFVAGAAIIPVHGLLLNRLNGTYGYVTGYEYVQRMTELAEADPDVRTIVYDIHSPGGTATGTRETWNTIRAARKPTHAVVDSYAYSAAYFLASAAGRISLTPTGGVGSIGAYKVRADFTKAMDAEGIRVEFIFAGAHKLDGNPYTEMSDEERDRHQKSIDLVYADFVSAVAEGRGLTEEMVRGTEAGTFDAPEALRIGLVNDIMAPRAALETAIRHAEGIRMTTISPEDLAAARADEKARMAAIIGSDEAKDRPKLAQYFATETDLSAEAAQKALAVAAKETASEKAADPLDAAMRAAGGGGVDEDGPQGKSDEDDHKALAARILAAHSAATSIKYQ